jgi:hypothetical protein
MGDLLAVAPGIISVFAFALGGVLMVLALLSLFVGQARQSLVFGLLGATGLVGATVAPSLFSGFQGSTEVFVWPGSWVGVLLLGLLVGAFAVLDRVDFHDSFGNAIRGFAPVVARLAGGTIITLALVAPSFMAVQAWSGNIGVQQVSAPRTLPAFVAAEAAQSPQVGTLVIEAQGDSYLVTLERGAGSTLMESSTLIRGRSTELVERDEDLARLAAMLIRPSAANPVPLFEKYGVSFVLLRDTQDSDGALSLAQHPELVSASSVESEQLWQVREPVPSLASSEPSGIGTFGQWFLWIVALAVILAIPTERRSRGTNRPIDDAVPMLGEETSDDL